MEDGHNPIVRRSPRRRLHKNDKGDAALAAFHNEALKIKLKADERPPRPRGSRGGKITTSAATASSRPRRRTASTRKRPPTKDPRTTTAPKEAAEPQKKRGREQRQTLPFASPTIKPKRKKTRRASPVVSAVAAPALESVVVVHDAPDVQCFSHIRREHKTTTSTSADPPGVKYGEQPTLVTTTATKTCNTQQQQPVAANNPRNDEQDRSVQKGAFDLPSDWGTSAKINLEADLVAIQDRYTVQSMIGCGAFGCVFRAISLETGGAVALKWFDESVDESMIANEARFLHDLRGVGGVVQFRGRIDAERGSFLAMEHCQGRDLRCEVNDNGPLTEARCRTIIFQLLATLKSMHDRNIMHRDIKPANLMISKDVFGMDKVTLVDLGICLAIEPGTRVRSKSGSEGFTAPEVADESTPFFNQGYDFKADMFSVGCVVSCLLKGRLCNPAVPDDSSKGMNFSAKDFVQNLTHLNPHFRMTAAEAMLHPFITGNGITPCARMVRRRAQELCEDSKPYLFIGGAFLLATQFTG